MKYNLTKDDHRGDRLPHLKGEYSPRWAGNKITYSGVHKWIASKLGKPNFCEICSSTTAKRYEWANLSGEYKRDLLDWKRVCCKCHKAMDNVSRKVWESRRKNGTVNWRTTNNAH